jgi:hypothetical protein
MNPIGEQVSSTETFIEILYATYAKSPERKRLSITMRVRPRERTEEERALRKGIEFLLQAYSIHPEGSGEKVIAYLPFGAESPGDIIVRPTYYFVGFHPIRRGVSPTDQICSAFLQESYEGVDYNIQIFNTPQTSKQRN